MNEGRRQFLQLATSSVSLWFLNRATIAQESYPSRPIHLIVGFTPGTAADIHTNQWHDNPPYCCPLQRLQWQRPATIGAAEIL